MSFTRKELKDLGLDEETRDKLIDMHLDSLAALREQLSKAKADAVDEGGKPWRERAKEAEQRLSDAQSADKAEDGETWKAKYQALVTKQAADKTRAATETAVKAWLKENGLVRDNMAQLLLARVDWDALDVDKDGRIKDAKPLEGLKADFGELFATTQEKGAPTLTPPQGGGKSYKTREEIMAIPDRAERRAQIAQHPDLFGLNKT